MQGCSRLESSSNSLDETLGPTESEIEAVISVLQTIADCLAIYRLIIDNYVRSSELSFRNYCDESNESILGLREESEYLSSVLEELAHSIREKDVNNVLEREIETYKQKQITKIAMVKEHEEILKELEKLQNVLDEETRANTSKTNSLKTKLFKKKNDITKLRCKLNIELEYVKVREQARCDAYHYRRAVDLKNHEKILKILLGRKKSEENVAKNVEEFYEKNIAVNRKLMSEWQERYEHEMQIHEMKKENFIAEIEARTNELEKLQHEFFERQEFIDKYLEEREAAEKLQKLEEHRRECVIRIQAWWRGTMVRRKLGPYRADEKKKKRLVKSKK